MRNAGFAMFYLVLLSLAAVGVAVSPAWAATADTLASQAKISMAEARAIAQKAYPGQIMKQELEKESGGSGLRYSFDLRQGTQWREVGVDAKTGQVLENAPESANPKD